MTKKLNIRPGKPVTVPWYKALRAKSTNHYGDLVPNATLVPADQIGNLFKDAIRELRALGFYLSDVSQHIGRSETRLLRQFWSSRPTINYPELFAIQALLYWAKYWAEDERRICETQQTTSSEQKQQE